MTRSGGQLAVAHRTQFPAQCLLGDADPEFLPDPLAQVDQPPAHNAINRRGRAAFDRRPQRRAVCLVQLRRLAGRLAGDQPVRTMGVELDHPSSNDLQCHPADRRRLGPPRPVIDSGQGRRVCAASFVPLAMARRRGASKSARNGIGMANRLRSPLLNQIRAVPGIPQRHALRDSV